MKLFINNENIVPCKDIKTLTNRINDNKSNSDIKNGEMKDIENSTCLDDVTLTSSCSVENDLMTRKSGLISGKCIDTIIEKNKADESIMENAMILENSDSEMSGEISNEIAKEDGAKNDSDSESLSVNNQNTDVLNGNNSDLLSEEIDDEESNFHLQLSDEEEESVSQVDELNTIATKPAVDDSELFKVPFLPKTSPPLVLDSVDSSSSTPDVTNSQQSNEIHDPETINSDQISVDDIISEIDKEIEHNEVNNAEISENKGKSEIIEKPIETSETYEKSNETSETDENPIKTSEPDEKPFETSESDEKPIGTSETDEKPIETSESNEKLSERSETVEKPIENCETNEIPIETLETIEKPSETFEIVEKPIEKSETNELIEESETEKLETNEECMEKSEASENLEDTSENKRENVDNECISENIEKIENDENNTPNDHSELLATNETTSEMAIIEVSCEMEDDKTANLSENTENISVKTHDEKSEDVEMNSVQTPLLASEDSLVSMNSSLEESNLEAENTEHMDVDKSSEVFMENDSEIPENNDNESKSSETCEKGSENPEIIDIEMKSLEVTEESTSCSNSNAELSENLEIVDIEMKSLEETEVNCSDSNTEQLPEVTETSENKSTEIDTKLSKISEEEPKIQEADKSEIVEKNVFDSEKITQTETSKDISEENTNKNGKVDINLVCSENLESSLDYIEKDVNKTEKKDLEKSKNVDKDSPIEINDQSKEVTIDSDQSKSVEISNEKNTSPVIELNDIKDDNSKTKDTETKESESPLVVNENESDSKLEKLLSAKKNNTDLNDDVILIEDEKDNAAPLLESTKVAKDPVMNELNEFIKVTSDVPKINPVTEPSKTTTDDSVIDIDTDETSPAVPKEPVSSTTTKEDLPRKRLLSDAEDDQGEKRLKIGDFNLKRRSVDDLDSAVAGAKRARLEENLEASLPTPHKETKQMLLKLLPILMEEGGSRDSLNVEELILAKIVEHLTEKSVNAQMKEKLLAHEQQMEQYRQKVAHLTKQFNDLSVVFDRLAVDLKSKDRPIAPVKITRSVGLQVSLPILGAKHGPARRKMLRQQSNNAATSVSTPPTTPSKPVTPQRQPQNVLTTRAVQQPPLQQIASPLKTPPVVSPTKTAAVTRRKPVSKPTTPQPNNANRADKSVIDLTDEDASSSAGRVMAPMASAAIRVMTPHQLGAQPLNQPPVVGGQRLAYVVPTNVSGANGARQVYIATTTAQGAPVARGGVRQNYVIRNSNGQLVQTQGVPQNVMIPQQRQSNVVLSNGHPQNVIMTNGQGRTQPLRVATNLQQINVRNTRGITAQQQQQQPPPPNTRVVTQTGRGPNVRTNVTVTPQPPQTRVMSRRSQQNNLDVVPINTRQQISRVHPAPLPQVANQPHMEGWKKIPPRPSLKISRSREGGIQLSWSMPELDATQHEEVASYQLFAYQELSAMPSTDQWKKVGDVKALPLPMACTLSSFQQGNKYHFAVRALDIHSRVSAFSFTQCITLVNASE